MAFARRRSRESATVSRPAHPPPQPRQQGTGQAGGQAAAALRHARPWQQRQCQHVVSHPPAESRTDHPIHPTPSPTHPTGACKEGSSAGACASPSRAPPCSTSGAHGSWETVGSRQKAVAGKANRRLQTCRQGSLAAQHSAAQGAATQQHPHPPGQGQECGVKAPQHHSGRLHKVGHLLQQVVPRAVGDHACTRVGGQRGTAQHGAAQAGRAVCICKAVQSS